VIATRARLLHHGEIRRASTHFVTERTTVLYAARAESPASHAVVVYPECTAEAHTVADHPVVVGTRLGVHRALMRLRRAQEVASSA
jgi:hypothetical protein